MKQLMSAFILSRLDYCNSLLPRLPWSTIAPLQCVQNADALIVLGLSSRDHVKPALRELRWLPVMHHITFKISLLMYLVHTHCCPSYVSHILSSISNNPFCQWLHSPDGTDFNIPCTNTKFGERAFCVSCLSHWNP